MTTTPKYLSDTPYGDDFFKVHSNIAQTLFEIIKSEDVSKHSFTLGLLGAWGSGKSMTVGQLRKKLVGEKEILFVEFDIWKYIDTSLYRSILIDLEKDLKIKAAAGDAPKDFEQGYKSDTGENLYDLLYSHTEFTVPVEDPPKSKLMQRIERWEKRKYFRVLSHLLLRPWNLLKLIFSYLIKRTEIIVLILVFLSTLVLGYVFRENIYGFAPFTKSATFKFIAKLFIGSVIGVAALEFLKEFFKDAYKELTPKAPKSILITSPPTFAQDQFEAIFRDIIKRICKDANKKIVIVFDNIDRCEAEITLKILTGLKTFLDVPNCFYLIPCDDNRIKKHFKESRAEDDFLDKIFQAYLRIPILTEENKTEFIEKCLKEANFNFNQFDKIKITQILTLAYKGDTPRQIKRFFNDFVSYYKLAKTIDPGEKFLLKDIAHFTFMISIKQKWPKVEETLLKHPNAFINYHLKQNLVDFRTPEFTQYLDSCINWIDLESNVSDFIYLMDAKQTGSNIQRILLEDFNGFVLNIPLIKEFDSFMLTLRTESKFIFWEKALDRLMGITDKHLKELDNTNGVELFKLYCKLIQTHDDLTYDGKRQSYILGHHVFLSNAAEFIPKLDKNKISQFEEHACKIIRQAGYSEDVTSGLYISLTKHCSIDNIKKIFANPAQEELPKLSGFIHKTNPSYSLKVVPISYFETLVGAITFTRDEKYIIDVFKYFQGDPQLAGVRKPIAVKLEQILANLQNINGPHPQDGYILDGLRILEKDDFIAVSRSRTDNYIQGRINILFQHGQPDQATEYFIQLIRHSSPLVAGQLQNGPHFNQTQYFAKLVERIPQDTLEFALNSPNVGVHFLNIGQRTNSLPAILKKVSSVYLSDKIEYLCLNNINSVNALLDELVTRRSQLSQEDQDKIETNILAAFSKINLQLLIDNHANIVPRLNSIEAKETLIECVLNAFHANQQANAEKAISALTFMEGGIGRRFRSSAIDILATLLEDNFDFDKQIKVIQVLNRFDKTDFSGTQLEKVADLLSEIHFPDEGSQSLVSDMQKKLNHKIKSNNVFSFEFKKQPHDDHAHNMLLDLKKYKYEITIQPSDTTEFWRYGIKFSKSPTIDPKRTQAGVPLFHLTKDKNSDTLYVTNYDHNFKLTYPETGNKSIKKNYKTEQIVLELSQNENGVQVAIKDNHHDSLLIEPILDSSYNYARLLAWGDSNDYQINATIKRIPTS